uniref:Uncharacterized protein n=1 Tax=Aureoumbra lagunensis TaxID=44058 RepID=A0A7S3NP77_9STRA|mmetsp:Transcript_20784/g.26892  ORF Transcript_20784/g.26892 Transcript_20784/m.26892 type:complete len:104 (+) Transcript_20784:80-391(+)
MVSGGLLVFIVVAVCVVAAILYAFKDKIPILKHLPEVTCGFCCGFGFIRPDYMEDDRSRRTQNQHIPDEEAPVVAQQSPQMAQVVAPVAHVQQPPTAVVVASS